MIVCDVDPVLQRRLGRSALRHCGELLATLKNPHDWFQLIVPILGIGDGLLTCLLVLCPLFVFSGVIFVDANRRSIENRSSGVCGGDADSAPVTTPRALWMPNAPSRHLVTVCLDEGFPRSMSLDLWTRYHLSSFFTKLTSHSSISGSIHILPVITSYHTYGSGSCSWTSRHGTSFSDCRAIESFRDHIPTQHIY